MWMKRIFLGLAITAIFAACGVQPVLVPELTLTSQPVDTPVPLPRTPVAAQFIDLKSGGFSLLVQQQFEFDTDDFSINLSDKRGELVISLNGRPYVASSYTLESFLEKYLAEMASRGGSFSTSDPYEIIIDGESGIAMDLTGNFLDTPIAGKAVAISPGKDFIVFGLGMSLLNRRKNGWAESGSDNFETIMESIKFKDEVKR